MFTARSRQNAFAKRRRAVAEAQAEESTESPEPTAVPYDTRNAESDGITDAPDVATYATGGVVEPLKALDLAPVPVEPVFDLVASEHGNIGVPVVVPHSVIDADTQSKIDAVLNHAITPVDDAAPVESEPVPEPIAPLAESEPKRGRGRPRPQETIDRDNAVHRLLQAADKVEGVSKEALAIALDEKEQQVYSSLRQLTKEKRAETRYVKPHGYRWFAL